MASIKFLTSQNIYQISEIIKIQNFGSDNESQTLYFCKQWLENQQIFRLFTSGSTGTPKAIDIRRSQMEASAQATIQALNLEKNDTAFICLNTNFIAGKMMLVRALLLEMNILVTDPSSNPLKNFDFTFKFAAFVPLQIQTILEESPEKVEILNQTKAIILGGAEVNLILEKKLQIIKSPVFLTYGMTETVSHIALKRLNGQEKQSFFQILPNVLISQNENECLEIQAPMTNFEKIQTNDRVKILDSKRFEWLGRIDNVINSGGIKIQIEELEQKINLLLVKNNFFHRIMILGKSDEKLGQKLILIIESKVFSQETEISFLALLKKKLNKFEIPKQIFYLEKFAQTSTNKLDRKQVCLDIISKYQDK